MTIYVENKIYYKTTTQCDQTIHLWLYITTCTSTSIVKYDILAATPYQPKYNISPGLTSSLSHLHEGNVGGNNPCWFVKRNIGNKGIYYENSHKQTVKNLPSIKISSCTHIEKCSSWYTAENSNYLEPPLFFKELLEVDPKYKYGYSIKPFPSKQKQKQIQFERLDTYWLDDFIKN